MVQLSLDDALQQEQQRRQVPQPHQQEQQLTHKHQEQLLAQEKEHEQLSQQQPEQQQEQQHLPQRQEAPLPSCISAPAQGASHNGVALPNLHVEVELR